MKKTMLLAVALMAVLVVPFVVSADLNIRNGPAGKSNAAHLYLYEKDSSWEIVDGGAWGKLKYNLAGSELELVFNGHGLEVDTDYSLIYYPEPQTTWPWPVEHILDGTSDSEGDVHIAGSCELDKDLSGAKIWLVLTVDIIAGELSGWNPTDYLFEYRLISFDDTDVP